MPPAFPLPRTSDQALPDQRAREGSTRATGCATSDCGARGGRAAAVAITACSIGLTASAAALAVTARRGGSMTTSSDADPRSGITTACPTRGNPDMAATGEPASVMPRGATTGPTRAAISCSPPWTFHNNATRAPVQPPTTIIRNRSGRPSPPNRSAPTPRRAVFGPIIPQPAARRESGAPSCPSVARGPPTFRHSASPRDGRRAAR